MGGKALPYDAEIEYLEASAESGMVDIDTGYVPTGIDHVARFSFTFIGWPNNQAGKYGVFLWNELEIAGGRRYRVYRPAAVGSESRINFYNGSGSTESGTLYCHIAPKSDTRYDVVFDGPGKTVEINGAKYTASNSDSTQDLGGSLHIFGDLKQDSADVAVPNWRFHSLVWTKGGDVVLDLIPVRKGGEGFVYDRVSGRLMGNSGTGRFILGPDK